jgi:hypothetical protein
MLRTSRKPLLIGAAAGLALGLVLGLIFGWLVWPVQWTNAHTYDLSPEAKAEYVTLLADAVRLDRNYAQAATLLEAWNVGEKQQAFTDAIQAAEAQGQPDSAQALRDLALTLGIPAESVSPPQTQPAGLMEQLRVPCLVFLVVLLLLVLGWIGLRLLSRKPAEKPATLKAGFTPVAPKANVLADAGPQAPLGQWITTYKLGEDGYDESYPIETASGEYLGECGVGISETLGSGEPDKVTAFEIWLFDKGDIRTVTKVLMSEYAFADDKLRAKLAAKGETVLVQLGTSILLETSGLQVMASVTELEYSKGDPAPNSSFAKLTVELGAEGKSVKSDADSLQ